METIILGIDPGSRVTGFGVVVSNGASVQHLDHGCIRTSQAAFSERLEQIYCGLYDVVRQYTPQEAAVEQVFMHHNPGAALKLGQARGAAIVAATSSNLTVAEYSARQVKQAVVGYGAAKKEQVQQMVRYLLHLTESPQEDAADALAIAVCHAHSRASLNKLKKETA